MYLFVIITLEKYMCCKLYIAQANMKIQASTSQPTKITKPPPGGNT